MSLSLQAKLLRVLQEKEVERIGSNKLISLDVRILATTNRQLKEEVQAGRFREDLFYRLNIFPLEWLPLRERKNDIIPLAIYLIRKHCHKQPLMPVISTRSTKINASLSLARQCTRTRQCDTKSFGFTSPRHR